MELHRKYWPGWEGETEVREVMDPSECAPQTQESTSQREDYVSRAS
jgi:hypothetical protein